MLASKNILPRVARCAALPATRSVPLSTSSVLSHKESSSRTLLQPPHRLARVFLHVAGGEVNGEEKTDQRWQI